MPALNINFGKTGAKRASWKDVNPRATLARIVQLNPDDEPKWRRDFWAYVKNRENYLRAITEYYLDHTIAAIKGQNGRRKHQVEDELGGVDEAVTEQALEHVERRVSTATKKAFNFLGMRMPDGRSIGDWTGRQGRQFGGWVAVIFKGVPAKTKLKDMRSNEEIAKLDASAHIRKLLG
jgi:hypothetical protein